MQARVLRVDWPAGQLPSLGDKMAAAREARYDLLLRACGEAGRGALLLAHHADDQAETFLLRLMHASGVLGLACMPRAADKRTGGWGGGAHLCLCKFRTRSTMAGAAPWFVATCSFVLPSSSSGLPSSCLWVPASPFCTHSASTRACMLAAEWGRVRMLRPLLDFRKAELEEYCRQRGLDYVVDPTNAELSFHRCATCNGQQ